MISIHLTRFILYLTVNRPISTNFKQKIYHNPIEQFLVGLNHPISYPSTSTQSFCSQLRQKLGSSIITPYFRRFPRSVIPFSLSLAYSCLLRIFIGVQHLSESMPRIFVRQLWPSGSDLIVWDGTSQYRCWIACAPILFLMGLAYFSNYLEEKRLWEDVAFIHFMFDFCSDWQSPSSFWSPCPRM